MLLLGDIHGSFSHLEYIINNTVEKNIIQVGDFGLGFKELEADLKTLKRIDDLLLHESKELYVIRGNHDNPKFWDGSYEDKFNNIYLVEDYAVHYIEDKKILFMGGAVSIDRLQRVAGKSWWLLEGFDYNEDKLTDILKFAGGVDMVVTHTSPSFCHPRGFNSLVHSFAYEDKTLLTDLKAERAEMDRAYSVICSYGKPSHWFYGHFHSDVHEEIDGTKFILLGVGNTTNI